MARMIPAAIQFRESAAEVDLFDSFRDRLSSRFTVLHHVPWILRDSSRRSIEGEADFVIVHPDLGALVLEAKGGRVRYDSTGGKWYQRSRNATVEHSIQDPFRQAANGVRAMLQFLELHAGWKRNWGPIGFGVCFPESTFVAQPTPAIRPELVMDWSCFQSGDAVEKRIREVMGWYPKEQFAQGECGAQAVVHALNHDVVLEQPLGSVVSGVERSITQLSEQQYRILRLLKHRSRLAVSGPAGSGKTVLAFERARELALAGRRTLLLCYNRPLADHLRHGAGVSDLLEISTLHAVCRKFIIGAGLPLPNDNEFHDRAPALLFDALSLMGGPYDAVIVDEAQVVDEQWWMPIEALLSDTDQGVLWLFFDDNQALYGRPHGLPQHMDVQPLHEVWRNTRPIYEYFMGFYDGDAVDFMGPSGPRVEVVPATGNLKGDLGRVLHRLVREELVRCSDIVVLTAHGALSSKANGQVGSFVLTEHPTRASDVKLSSVHRFLGLESPVVVVCEMPPRCDPEYDRLMYVAASRARALLVVLE